MFPLVLYNGDTRWTAPLDLKTLIALPQATPLWPYQPAIRYYLIDEGRYPDGKPGSLVGLLFQLENCRTREDLQTLLGPLATQLGTVPASLKRAFVTWLKHVVAPRRGTTLTHHDLEALAEVNIMLATRVKQWEQEILAEGMEKGMEKGVQHGESTLLRRQLALKFGALPDHVQATLESASRDELETWGLRVLTAQTLSGVFEG